MAPDAVQEATLEEQPAAVENPRGGLKSLLGGKKAKVAVMVLVVMSVQVAIGYFLLPRPADVAGQANSGAVQTQTGDSDLESNVELAEVHIDTFNCTSSIGDGGTVHIKFDLGATVASRLTAQFDREVNSEHKLRVRQAVEKVARSATLDELNDPNLSTIKRLIKDEVNKVLRKSYIQEVVISEFTLLEQ